MSLWSEFLTNNGRPIHKWKHYFPAYERHLSRFINTDVVMFEIGSGEGGSAQMWKRYLGPHARIVSIDVRPEVAKFAEDQIEFRIGDQSDAIFLASLIKEFGTPDIVLDDGSHVMEHMLKSFEFLYPEVSRSGVYAVEDLHTCYWPRFGGGLQKPDTFIERCKGFIDELHADYTQDKVESSEFSRTTLSMHFYDSIVFFEKGRHAKNLSLLSRGR